MSSTLLSQKRVKTRKQHICQGCGKKIDKGQMVNVSVIVGDDGIFSLYECDSCFEYVRKHCHKCKDFEYCIGENYMVGAVAECMRESLYVG